jgi:RimJ/RimL family protein N-acetyltransferase
LRSKVSGLSFRGVELETEWLLLRGWLDRDLEPYARICAEPEVMRFIGDGSTLTRKQSGEQISYFVRHWQERGFGLWAVEEKASGAFVGFAGLAIRRIGSRAGARPRWGGGSAGRSGEGTSPRRWRGPA